MASLPETQKVPSDMHSDKDFRRRTTRVRGTRERDAREEGTEGEGTQRVSVRQREREREREKRREDRSERVRVRREQRESREKRDCMSIFSTHSLILRLCSSLGLRVSCRPALDHW